MTVNLGMFMMPFHHPDRDYAAILTEDQDAVILADRLCELARPPLQVSAAAVGPADPLMHRGLRRVGPEITRQQPSRLR